MRKFAPPFQAISTIIRALPDSGSRARRFRFSRRAPKNPRETHILGSSQRQVQQLNTKTPIWRPGWTPAQWTWMTANGTRSGPSSVSEDHGHDYHATQGSPASVPACDSSHQPAAAADWVSGQVNDPDRSINPSDCPVTREICHMICQFLKSFCRGALPVCGQMLWLAVG